MAEILEGHLLAATDVPDFLNVLRLHCLLVIVHATLLSYLATILINLPGT